MGDAPPLPEGFGVVLDPGSRRTDGGSALIGGAPVTVLRLSPAGARALDGLAAGATVPASGAANRLARRLVDRGLAHPRPAARVSGPPVTVVIPVRDDPGGLSATLASVGLVEHVLVVDDGSIDPDAVLDAVAGSPQSGRTRVLRLACSQGPGGARQVGWEAAATDVVAFVDAGCAPGGGWLEVLTAHLADPAVAAVAPRVRAGPGRFTPGWLDAYERTRSPLDLGRTPAAVRPGGPVPYVPTAALVVRRAALDAVGGFDLGLRFGEDVDLVWRLVGAGWVVRYEPAASVCHPARPTLRALVGQRFDYGRSAAPLATRHGAAVAPLALSPWSAAPWAVAALGHPYVAAGVAAAGVAAVAPRLQRLDHPWAEAMRLVGGGHLRAGRLVADACRRPWWPLLGLACLRSRRARVAAVVAVLVPPLVERRDPGPRLGLPAWLARRLADDLAYGAGVWAGAARSRSSAALRPTFTSRPRRRDSA